MIDTTLLMAHRTAASLLKRGCTPTYRAHQRRLNFKLHAVCDGHDRPLIMLLSEGQMSDFKGAALMIGAIPKAKTLLGDKSYKADWFREALAKRKIAACILSKLNRKVHIPHDVVLYRQRHKIENMFGKLKDWRRIHTPATSDSPTHSCPLSASPQPSSSRSINESRA